MMPTDIDQLRELVRQNGFLVPNDNQPAELPDGGRASWVLYVWNFTLTAEGLELAARCLLERLRDFSSTQLATNGYAAVPLLAACLLQGNGRYVGLCVREDRKAHGTKRKIDGPGDKTKSVVVLDD